MNKLYSTGRICPGCGKEIKEGEAIFMEARDRPIYCNVYWHKDCFPGYEGEE